MDSTTKGMEQPQKEKLPDKPQQTLKCPRCESSNTKFCYYNNYSLTQPRHFCKACKRYWTRGGTLRNVPVGGGCRKNRRNKKLAIFSSNPSPNIDISSSWSINCLNPLFNGNPRDLSDLNIPLGPRVSDLDTSTKYDIAGLVLSSTVLMGSDYVPMSNSILSNYPLVGSPSSCPTTNTSSAISSSLDTERFLDSAPYGDGIIKDEKIDHALKRLDWNFTSPNQSDQITSAAPNALVWNAPAVGSWFDSSNIGSSISLI